MENDALTRKNRKKAAGYYLYALEKGGNPYFRSLKEFAGTGWRVRKILGAAHQDKYLAYIKNVESELKKNPGSKELNNDLSMGELGYMQKIWGEGDKTGVQADLKAVFGNRFFTGGLGQAQYGMWYQQSKIDETVKNEGAKPFHQLFKDSWTGWYEGFRVNDVL
ncbi:hypothetical protein KBC03_03820 [Patescibacteria group bacterium]|nr:hypothetical protein [Patescibacteria group bacterium]